jgi:Fe2+ or Zn2+ uptake regulation protein
MTKSDLDAKARAMLQAANLYSTKSRVAILKVLLKTATPLTQDQIAVTMGQKRLDKVTVYRTLSSLLKAGLVHKAYLDKRTWHFELAGHCTSRQCHPHFTCTNCGGTHCLTDMSVPMLKSPHKGFIISRQQVRLEGLCPACA